MSKRIVVARIPLISRTELQEIAGSKGLDLAIEAHSTFYRDEVYFMETGKPVTSQELKSLVEAKLQTPTEQWESDTKKLASRFSNVRQALHHAGLMKFEQSVLCCSIKHRRAWPLACSGVDFENLLSCAYLYAENAPNSKLSIGFLIALKIYYSGLRKGGIHKARQDLDTAMVFQTEERHVKKLKNSSGRPIYGVIVNPVYRADGFIDVSVEYNRYDYDCIAEKIEQAFSKRQLRLIKSGKQLTRDDIKHAAHRAGLSASETRTLADEVRQGTLTEFIKYRSAFG